MEICSSQGKTVVSRRLPSKSLSGAIKRVRDAVHRHGNLERKADVIGQINDIEHWMPVMGDAATQSAEMILELWQKAVLVPLSDPVMVRSAARALQGLAPFHRQKNSIGDAVIIETFADEVAAAPDDSKLVFVTHNKHDFSHPNGNEKLPHPDLETLFIAGKSSYFITLDEALREIAPELLEEIEFETEYEPEQRRLAEIVESIDELTTKVWYNRHKFREEQIESGHTLIVEKETFPPRDPMNRPIQRDIWEGALASAAKVEKKYGSDTLGPWNDFEWGMLNGKLSALRWILGEDWDELYT